jgi:PAS fold.
MRVDEDRGRDRSLAYALAYWVAGSLWILLSDRLLFGDTGPLLIGSVAKGLGFVTVTALLLWGMMRRNGRHLREAAERAERSEETLRSLLNATEEGIAEIDAEGRLIRWNPAFAELFGVREDSVREVGRVLGPEAATELAPLLRVPRQRRSGSRSWSRGVRASASSRFRPVPCVRRLWAGRCWSRRTSAIGRGRSAC